MFEKIWNLNPLCIQKSVTQLFSLCHKTNLCLFLKPGQDHTQQDVISKQMCNCNVSTERISLLPIQRFSKQVKYESVGTETDKDPSTSVSKTLRKTKTNPKCFLPNKILQLTITKRLSLSKIFKKYSSKRWDYLKIKESKVNVCG